MLILNNFLGEIPKNQTVVTDKTIFKILTADRVLSNGCALTFMGSHGLSITTCSLHCYQQEGQVPYRAEQHLWGHDIVSCASFSPTCMSPLIPFLGLPPCLSYAFSFPAFQNRLQIHWLLSSWWPTLPILLSYWTTAKVGWFLLCICGVWRPENTSQVPYLLTL